MTPQEKVRGRYRKRPVEVEAVQFTGTNHDDVAVFMGCGCGVKAIKADCPYDHSLAGPRALFIRTLEGSMRADRGDWIIQGVAGEFYPCKPEIFKATYEPVDRDGEQQRVDLGPERMRVVDAPDGGLDVVPEEQFGAGDAQAIRVAARELADAAATAVCEPRRFHENDGERQQALGRAVAAVRNALSTQQAVPSTPASEEK